MKKNDMERFIKYVMGMFGDCQHLVIIDGNKWYGDYGHCVSIMDNGSLKYFYENLRSVYKIAHRIFNNTKVDQDDRMYFNGHTLVLLNNAHALNRYDQLYILANGQVYDAWNEYWYDIHSSKILKRWIKEGYIYIDPQEFFEDQYSQEREDWDE